MSQSDDLKIDDVDCWRLLTLADKKNALLKSQIQTVIVLSTCEVRKKNDCCYRSAKIKTTIFCERLRQCLRWIQLTTTEKQLMSWCNDKLLKTIDEINDFWYFDESKSHAAIILKSVKKMNFQAKKLATIKYWMSSD